jgi:hypothetical protein
VTASLIGWGGLAAGLAGLVAYSVIVLRQPRTVRMLNGSGLLLTSLALIPSRMLTALARGPFAFAVEAVVVLLVLSALAQAAAGWRNRGAWDGTERRASVLGETSQ